MSGTHNWPFAGYQAPLSMKPVKSTTGKIVIDRMAAVVPVDTTAGAAAITLARPTKAGIVASIVLVVDNGDLTLTVTGGYNADADTSITFADAGDFVRFISFKVGSYYYWRVLASEGTNVAAEDFKVDQLTLGATLLTATGAEINTACDQSVQVMTPGDGFLGAGGFYLSSIQHIGTIYKTTIFADITGLASSTTDTDIIGLAAGGAAHFGQITAALNGTLVYGQVTWLETPATGADDINFWSATEGTGAYNDDVTGLTEVSMYDKTSAAAGAAATQIALTALPAANKYMYLANGEGGTVGTYTAGQFMLELWGA
jgi:hypothetical protein